MNLLFAFVPSLAGRRVLSIVGYKRNSIRNWNQQRKRIEQNQNPGCKGALSQTIGASRHIHQDDDDDDDDTITHGIR